MSQEVLKAAQHITDSKKVLKSAQHITLSGRGQVEAPPSFYISILHRPVYLDAGVFVQLVKELEFGQREGQGNLLSAIKRARKACKYPAEDSLEIRLITCERVGVAMYDRIYSMAQVLHGAKLATVWNDTLTNGSAHVYNLRTVTRLRTHSMARRVATGASGLSSAVLKPTVRGQIVYCWKKYDVRHAGRYRSVELGYSSQEDEDDCNTAPSETPI
jgi:hypothetical protein